MRRAQLGHWIGRLQNREACYAAGKIWIADSSRRRSGQLVDSTEELGVVQAGRQAGRDGMLIEQS